MVYSVKVFLRVSLLRHQAVIEKVYLMKCLGLEFYVAL
jgi:hypothetical protein